MIVAGVKFKKAGKLYYFDPAGLAVKKDTWVIVETDRGADIGMLAMDSHEADVSHLPKPIKKILREATPADLAQNEANKQIEEDYFNICKEKVAVHGLGMNLVDKEMSFDRRKITFYFTADGRLDFRELVKDLTPIFRMYVYFHQLAVRDEAKMIGGIGICGRSLCCSTFINDFPPIQVKMAKDQGLALNPAKFSGACGRLMCCLKYEEETYIELTKNLPNVGDKVQTPDGSGAVLSVNILRQTVKVAVKKNEQDDPNVGVYAIQDIKVRKTVPPPCERGCSCGNCGKAHQ